VNRWLDRILLGAVIVLAGTLIYVVTGTLEPRIVNAGDTAPNFKITTDSGKTVSVDNFGGKLLVLNFWASWCPPCVEETPSLEEFARELGPEGVVVVAVSIDRNENLYHRFIQRFGISFETARDPEANISSSYGTFQIPETYLIDQHGKVLEKVISNQNWMDPEFLAAVRKML
jgi:cytochrome c biogenesis protein CcmG, thiol:disulfide interchange protein DsbE